MKLYNLLKIGSIFSLLLILFKGCPIVNPTGDSTITIVNNSDKTLLFYFDSTPILKGEKPENPINSKSTESI